MTTPGPGPARLFVALLPAPEALDELGHAVEPLRAAHPGLRWTAPRGWHLTLAFLGDVRAPDRERLDAALGRVAEAAHPLRLALRGGGHFGDNALWTGVAGDVRALTVLARAVGRVSARYGSAPRERRPYRAHLTLARARGRGGERGAMADAAARLAGFAGLPWTAERFHLVRSSPAPGGSWYDDEAAWPLGGDQA